MSTWGSEGGCQVRGEYLGSEGRCQVRGEYLGE